MIWAKRRTVNSDAHKKTEKQNGGVPVTEADLYMYTVYIKKREARVIFSSKGGI